MVDARRTVSIDITATDKISNTLKDIAGKFESIAGGFKVFSGAVDSLVSKLSGIKIPDSLGAASSSIKSLDGVKLPDLTNFAAGVAKLATVGEIKDLSPVVRELKKLADIKVPGVLQLAIGLEKLSSSSINIGNAASAIKGIVTPLERLSRISIPNIGLLASGIAKLSTSVISKATSDSIVTFVNAIRNLDGIKIPNLRGIATGIEQIGSIGNLTKTIENLNQLSIALNGFKGVKIPSVYQLAQGFKQLADVNVAKVVQNINQLAAAISVLERSGTLKNFGTFAQDLRALQGQLASITPQLAQVQNGFTKVGKSAEESGNKVKGFGTRVMNYFQYRVIADTIMGLQNGIQSAIGAIRDYDQSLKDLQAITGATSSEVAVMGTKIIQVAKDTKFSATEVAQGMVVLGQAGLSASEAVDTIASVSDLATGTLSDMATSVDLVSTAMNVFDIAAGRSTHIADVFANAINKSKLTMDKLKTAFNYVGPVAANAGISFEESAAAMMTLANTGQRASTIGTGLRRVFSDLVDPPAKLAAAVEKAGITLDDLDPRVNSLSKVFSNLNLVVNDSQEAFDIFGKWGANAVLALKGSDSAFSEMLETVGKSGTAAEMASIQVEGLGVIYKNLADRAQVLAISLGKAGISDMMRGIGKAGQAVVEALDVLVNTSIGGFITKSALYIAAGTAMVVVTGKLVTAIRVLVGSYGIALSAQATLLSNGLLLIPGAATNASASLYKLATVIKSAAAATWAFAAASTVASGIITSIAFPIAVLAIQFINAVRSIDDFKKSTQEALEEASKFESLKGAFKGYNESIRGLAEGSNVLKDANIGLRKELLKTAEGNMEVSVSATVAANSIDPYTGKILDNGDALRAYNEEIGKLNFSNLAKAYSDSIKNIESQTSSLNSVLNISANALGATFTFAAEAIATTLDRSFDFSKPAKKFQDLSTEARNSLDFSESLRDGKKSFEDFAKYVAELDSIGFKNLSGQGKDLVETFRTIEETSSAFLSNIMDSGEIDMDSTVNQLAKIAEKAGISAEMVEALTYRFNLLKEAREKLAEANTLDFVKDFENQGANINLKLFDEEHEKATGDAVNKYVANIKLMIEENQKLADQHKQIAIDYEKNLKTMGKDAAAEQQYNDTYNYREKVKALLKKGADDFGYNAAREVTMAKESLDAQLELNKEFQNNKDLFGRKNAEARKNYEKEVADAFLVTYDPKKLKDLLDTQTKVHENANQERLHSISMLEANGTIIKEEADKRRFQSELQKYNELYQLALDHQEKIKGTKGHEDKDLEDANQAVIQSQEKRTEFLRKNLEKSTEEEYKAGKEIVKINDKITAEKKKNSEDVAKDASKYHRDIITAEHTLSKRIQEINKSLHDKLTDFLKKRRENEQKTRTDISSIYTDANDKIRSINQRSMTDREKEADNFRTYQSKIKDGAELIERARRTGNKFLLERGQDYVKSAMDIGSSLANQKQAIDAVKESAALLAKARKFEGQIVNLEIKKEENLVINQANLKRKLAKEDAEFKIKKIKEIYNETKTAEDGRHTAEMTNLNNELAIWKEKLRIANDIQKVTSNVSVPVSGNMDSNPTGKPTNVTIDSAKVIAENAKVQQSIKETGTAYQKSITTANEKIIDSAEHARTSIGAVSESVQKQIDEISKNGFQKVLVDGKETYTNLTVEQLKATAEIAKAMKTTGKDVNAVFSVAGIDTEGITKAKGEVSGLVKIVNDGATLTISTETARQEVDKAKKKISEIETSPTTKAPVEIVAEDGASIVDTVEKVKTDVGGISQVKPEVKVTVTKDEFNDLYAKLQTLKDEVVVTIFFELKNTQLVYDVAKVINLLGTTESKPKIIADVQGNEQLALMDTIIANINNKFVEIIVTTGNSITDLQNVLRKIQDVVAYDGKNVDISVNSAYTNSGSRAVALASGGSVYDAFRRLKDRFITQGSGLRDDVPAMLKKDEFVQRPEAVKHYGVDFMRRLNALQVPKFSTGGLVGSMDNFVQHFARGGSVLSGSIGKLKKKFNEILGDRASDLNDTTIVNMNQIINNTSGSMITDVGKQSIAALRQAVNSTASNFATGGSLKDIEKIKADISSSYESQIRRAAATGNVEAKSILEKEKFELLKASGNIQVVVDALTKEYQSYVDTKTRQYNDSVRELKAADSESSLLEKTEYEEKMNNLTTSYQEDMASLLKSDGDNEKQYKESIEQYNTDRKELVKEYEDSIEENKVNASMIAIQVNRLAKFIDKEAQFMRSRGRFDYIPTQEYMYEAWKNNGGNTPLHYTKRHEMVMNSLMERFLNPYRGGVTLESLLGMVRPQERGVTSRAISAVDAYQDPKSIDYRKSGPQQKTGLDKAYGQGGAPLSWNVYAPLRTWEELMAYRAQRSNETGYRQRYTKEDDQKPDFAAIKSYLEEIRSLGYFTDNLEFQKSNLEISKNSNEYDQYDAVLRKAEFQKNLSDLELNRNEFTTQYVTDKQNNALDRSKTIDRFKEDKINEQKDYKEAVVSRKASFKDQLASLENAHIQDIHSRKTTYESDVESTKNEFKRKLEEATKNVEVGTSTIAGNVTSAVTQAIATDPSISRKSLSTFGLSGIFQNYSKLISPIEELLKKLGTGVRKYNMGGFVQPTSSSIPGRDSIFAALTPKEYVMPENVVSFFGKDFMDSLRNFRIPQFNLGGYVGSVDSSKIASNPFVNRSPIIHSIELSFDGGKYGPFEGDQSVIEAFINALNSSKMRSSNVNL